MQVVQMFNAEKQELDKLQLTLEDVKVPEVKPIKDENEPYAEPKKLQANRYAGVFVVMILLVSKYKWFN